MRRRSRNIPKMPVVTMPPQEVLPNLSPLNLISRPHCSAMSFQRGLALSTSAIFFPRRQPFSCFSRLMAVTNVIICFVVNESMHFIFPGEAFNGFDFVLPDSSSQITSHANIQGAGATHDDVSPKLVKRTLTHGASDVSTGCIGRTPCCVVVATSGIGMFRLRAATVRAALRST
jgi:hypothetical protein